MTPKTKTEILLFDALSRMYQKGWREFTAADLADEMWPDCRSHNSNGQKFNMSAGVAGRILRRSRACFEVRNRVWVILPEFVRAYEEELE